MTRQLNRNLRAAMVVAWIALLIPPLRMCFAQTPATRDVLIEASPQLYWIARVEPGDAPPRVISIIQQRSIGTGPQWKQIAQLDHRITSVCRFGTQLAALLENGDWMVISEQQSAGGPLPEDGAKLLMLAEGSGPNARLWAIAAARSGRMPTTTGTTQPAATLPVGTRLLYGLDQGQWKWVAPLPAAVSAADVLSLSALDAPILTAMNDSGVVQIFTWNDAQKHWDSLGTIKAAPGLSQAKMLDGADRPMLWLCDENGGGEVRLRSSADDTTWSVRIPLALLANAPKGAASDAVVAGGNIRVVLFTKDDKLLEYSYPMDGSAPAQQTTIPTTSAPAEPKAFEWISAVAAGLLMLVLLGTMRRRGQGVPLEAIQAAGIKLAPYGLRLLAGIIDALPLIGTVLIVFARSNVTDPQQVDELVQSAQPAMYAAVAVYILHTLISEALWGWTIGKKICGLRIANFDGSRPGLRAVILRNVLRIVDVTMFYLPPLLVFVSPLRQRAGDIAAETIVILSEEKPEKPKT